MENQEKIWNKLAESWYNFRNKPEDIIEYFKKKYCVKRGKIIDLGCGNARNLIPFRDFECYGVDFSDEMLKYARLLAKKHRLDIKLKKDSLEKLSFKDNFFDYALMLASLHHLENNEKRISALKEIYRTLKKDGIAMISVWNRWQLRFLFKKKDLLIPWKVKDNIYYRYYHLFSYFELRGLLKKVNFKILESKLYKGNIMFVVKK